MGLIDIDICTTSDGTYLYGFAQAHEYDVYHPGDSSISPLHYILLKSTANPTSYDTAGWGFVASVPVNNTMYTDLLWTPVCMVDYFGVVRLMVAKTGPAGSKTVDGHVRGIQWDPAGTNNIANATGSGGWSILGSSNSVNWDGWRASTLAMVNSQPTLIFKDTSDAFSMDFAVLDPTSKIFNLQTTTWLSSSTIGLIYNADRFLFANGVLYMVGEYDDTMYLSTVPLNYIGPIPPGSQFTVSKYQLPPIITGGGCHPVNVIFMNILGRDLYMLCEGQNSTNTIYHHDGLNWTTPIFMPAVPWFSPNSGSFARSSGGEIWAFVPNNGDTFVITISNNSANWTRAVNSPSITQTFGVYTGPTLTHSPTPQPTQGVSSGIGINGGAIAGIIVGVLAVLIAMVFVIRSRRKKSYGIKNNDSGVVAERRISGKQEMDEIKQEEHVPISVAPNFNTPVAQNTQYSYAYDGTQSYPAYHQQQVPLPASALPSSRPYTSAQPYSTAPSPGTHPYQ
ncbi:hypothetical protein BGX26_000575 [Mortierella sp. AD094]|nr:hypothetical protein BGX26_000575 [Mortierella sp. AD094]